jgi:hypothetical protein
VSAADASAAKPAGPPLASSLAKLDPRTDWIDAAIGGADDTFVHASAVEAGLELLRDAAEVVTGPSDPRTVGAMMMWRYAAIATSASLILGRDRRVPFLAPIDVAIRPPMRGQPARVRFATPRFWCLPGDPAADHPHARGVLSDSDLLEAFVHEIERVIEPAVDPMRKATHLGEKVLWGIAAHEALTPLARHYDSTGDPSAGIELAAAVLARSTRLRLAPPELLVLSHRGRDRLACRLGVCCRAYRRIGGEHLMCEACPIRPRAAWLESIPASWDAEARIG